MTTANKANRIIFLARTSETRTRQAMIDAKITLAGVEAMYDAWVREYNSDPDNFEPGPGFHRPNPYNVENAQEQVKRAEEAYNEARETLEFATDEFVRRLV
jgi:hypothetical protein